MEKSFDYSSVSRIDDFNRNPEKYYHKPFRIIGNLHFVGTQESGCYLIDSKDGLILLDTGYYFAASQLIDSIWRCGFDPKNIKIICHTHCHSDHCGATKFLSVLSGAKTYMGRKDVEFLINRIRHEKEHVARFIPDVMLDDGDKINLGNCTIECYSTPGHSPGNISFFFDVTEDNKKYRVCLPGGIGLNMLHKEQMERLNYMTAREEYFSWIERMLGWNVDVTLGSHTYQADMIEKYNKRESGFESNPFICPEEWKKTLLSAKKQLEQLIQDEKDGRVYLDLSGERPVVVRKKN